MNFFTVTTKKNIDSISKAVKIHEILHGYESYSIICPIADQADFISEFKNNSKVNIISENTIIELNKFIQISKDLSNKYRKKDINSMRINWYYQQVLKIAYALNNIKPKHVMWDADTVPLNEIKFFDKNNSLKYGSLNEYHENYYKTISTIFKFELPKFAYTIQFFTLTDVETEHLKNILSNYMPSTENESYGDWIARIVLSSVIITNSNLDVFNQSLFSEQELVGLSNQTINKSLQKPLRHFRPQRLWTISNLRIKIIKLLNYEYYTLESSQNSENPVIDFFYFWIFLFYDLLRSILIYSKNINKLNNNNK